MNVRNSESGLAHPVALGVIVLTLLVVGFTGYRVVSSRNDDKQLSSAEQQEKAEEALPLDLSDVLEISKVKELAVQSTDAAVSNVELENEEGALVYKVTLSDGSIVVLNAKTGTRVKTDDSKTETEHAALPANFTAAISFEKAREIAQAKFPSGKITKMELEAEEGKVVISVRFADKARVDVNATTGEVVRVKNPKEEKPASTPSKNQPSSTSSSTPTSNSGSGGSRSGSSGSTSGSSNSGSGSSNSGSGSSSSNDDHDDDEGDDDGGHHGGDSDDDSDGSNSDSGSSGSGSGH